MASASRQHSLTDIIAVAYSSNIDHIGKDGNMFKFDEKELRLVCAVLDVINLGASPDHIVNMVNRELEPGTATYLSTSGWVAHTWIMEGEIGITRVKVSLTPYTVACYLDAINGSGLVTSYVGDPEAA